VTPAARRCLEAGTAALALLVALATLTPEGAGWGWGDPATELRWYATGLGDPDTLLQLVGNLGLLAPCTVLAVLRWPVLRPAGRLLPAAVTVAVGIEVLQWVLPLGRVVSPLDAGLNALGALLAAQAAVLVASLTDRRTGSVGLDRVGAGA
jgi:glycopeptide antibiotics resistance protein